MNSITPEQFQAFMPLTIKWAEEQECQILANGTPLSAIELADAVSAGITQPERVRLLAVQQIPMPLHPALNAAARLINLITPNTRGLTLRYGIFIRNDWWGNRRLIVHELAHTAQYERLGGITQFLQRYLDECRTIGYPEAPMEQEAIEVANRICG